MFLPRPLVPRLTACVAALLLLAGCAGLPNRDPLQINVVGLEPVDGRGLEWRMGLKLRVQNPNDSAISYDGVAVDLNVNGKPFATGVSDQAGTVPRYGETVLTIPISVSAVSAMRQAWNLAGSGKLQNVPYVLRGKLGGGTFGSTRFSDQGSLTLPGFE